MSDNIQAKRYDAILKMMQPHFGGDEEEGKSEREPLGLVRRYVDKQKLREASKDTGPWLLYGVAAPAPSLGKQGDFYLEAGAGWLWGPKEAGYGWQHTMPLHEDYEAPEAFIKDTLGVSGVIR